MAAAAASQRRAADSVSVSSTVCKSNAERLMTLSTSAVAVCCWRDSRSSLSRRVFSIAITVFCEILDQRYVLGAKGANLLTENLKGTDQFALPQHRYHEK